MSGWEWLETRTGALSGVRRFGFEEIPGSSGWPQVFGSVALFVLLLQAVTGVLLSLNYAASPGDAYDSVSYIVRDIIGGRLIRNLHHWGASVMVIVVAAHAIQVFLFGAYKRPREVTWLCGIALLLVIMGFALTGYLLPWDNRAYWGTVVSTQIAGQAPGLGSVFEKLLGAENGVGAITFTRFYAMHVLVLPAATLLLTAVHLYLVRKHGVTPSPADSSPRKHFFPLQALKDTVAIFITFCLLVCTAAALDAPLERMADPTDSSYVPRPEWYFLFLFQALKFFHGALEPLAGVALPGLCVLALALLPFLDRAATNSWRKRSWAVVACTGALSVWTFLTVSAVEATPHTAAPSLAQPEQQRLLSLSPDELAGYDYFRRGNCRDCHNLLEGQPRRGPTLATLVDRRAPEWLESHFRDGRSLNSREVNALLQFASKVSPQHAIDLERSPAALLSGADLFVKNLCASCHKVNGAGGQIGPPLNGLRTRRSREWAIRHFVDPQVMSPGTIMPRYHFSSNEQNQLLDYLFALP